MSYELTIEHDRPTVYKTFDDATNKSHPLIAGAGSSAVVTTTPFTHDFAGWTQGPFTLELWVKPLSDTCVILGHDDDGITYDGHDVKFTVKQNDGSLITASLPATSKVMYVVAQYTGYSIVLQVDQKVISADATLPLATTGQLKTGGVLSIDALAIYQYLLSADQITQHYQLGTAFPNIDDVYSGSDNYFALTDAQEDTHLIQSYPQWDGYFDGVVISDQGLQNDVGISGGYWYTNLVLTDVDFKGSKVEWNFQGTPPVVDVSSDNGTTWLACTSHDELPGMTTGVDPLIRVTFPQDTILTNFTVVIYEDVISVGQKSHRVLSIERPAVSASEVMLPYQQDDNGGMFVNGGSVSLLKDMTEDANAFTSISYWYKGPDVANVGVRNGGSGFYSNQWNFNVINGGSINQAVELFTEYAGQISNLVVWRSNQDPAALYKSHFQKQTLNVQEPSRIEVYEPANGVKVYQNNWILL